MDFQQAVISVSPHETFSIMEGGVGSLRYPFQNLVYTNALNHVNPKSTITKFTAESNGDFTEFVGDQVE